MLLQQIKRLQKARRIDKLVVATSTQASDDPVALMCLEQNITCYRGELNDVLGRFFQCAKLYQGQNIIRLTGDCPLLDPAIVDAAIALHLKTGADYTSNCTQRFFPDGQDVEVFTFSALELANKHAEKPSQREHVTPYIREHNSFSQSHLVQDEDWSQVRMSVDHPVDFKFAECIYQHLYDTNADFTLADIMALLQKKPDLASINQDIEFNEGYLKSLQEDQEQGFN